MSASIRIYEFDTWRPGYGYATVSVYEAGTTILATIYSDANLTTPVANPITLIQKSDAAGVSYGKFAVPYYIGEPYQLLINSVDQTGIQNPPLTTLAAQDASLATVKPTGATVASALDDLFARHVDVRDYGVFVAVGQSGASATTNNASLVAAIAAVSALGGGFVDVPAGTYQITSLTLPLGVVIRGQGRKNTLLQSTIANSVITVSGERAGLQGLTLDGISQVTNSIGVFAELQTYTVLTDVEIKRFATGLQLKGGLYNHWKDLFISNCVSGYVGHGDSDGGKGGGVRFNRWDGGLVELCSSVGIELKNIDEITDHNTFVGIEFSNNTGIAVHIIGARASRFESCNCLNNTNDLKIEDGSPLNAIGDNTVIGFEWTAGSFAGTSSTAPSGINLSGTLAAVAFRKTEFLNVSLGITTPQHNILAQDCREIANVVFGGDTPTAWIRSKTFDRGSSSGLTTGNVPTKAWGIELAAGQRVLLIATVVARARNNTNSLFSKFIVGAQRPGGSLQYMSQTVNFTAGNILTGQTSKATARIAADNDLGATGTLTLQDIVGTFLDNEIITDTGGGSANANGTVTLSNVVLKGSNTSLFLNTDDVLWAAAFAASGSEVILNVTGDTAMNVEWTVDVDVVWGG